MHMRDIAGIWGGVVLKARLRHVLAALLYGLMVAPLIQP